ncbi:molybdopterin synthase sulfur carrier subunit isoform X2 [Nymphaea colorata]|nr:molybdopterin synthase sulfur carrier subunit isoform X2 [Nymphaea colorata]XP_049934635.1 molybdopterin synthase sulfur carrier subunit isoform X2 [Nymphaea colorata]
MDGESKTEKQVEDIENETRDPLLNIKVLFFARARDLSGTAETDLSVRVGFTAHDCLVKLLTVFPRLEEIKNCIVVALNQEYVRESTTVKNGDELAIIPPISGG